MAESFEVQELPADEENKSPTRKGQVGLCLRGTWYRITRREELVPKDDPVNSLDVQFLYNKVLAPILGIGCPREDERIK